MMHDVIVVGAGICGLTAARALADSGRTAVVLDKGRGVGGRMSTRRIGRATFDHGAQYFTARDRLFVLRTEQWLRDGDAEVWMVGAPWLGDQEPRLRGAPTMSAVARAIASGLDVRTAVTARAARREADRWVVETRDGASVEGRLLLLTPPLPQALALLDAGGASLPGETDARLRAVAYERCIAVMATLDGPSRLPDPGCLGVDPPEPVGFIADNQRKGVSGVPCATIHAGPRFSLERWDDDREAVGRELFDAARDRLGVGGAVVGVHGWKFAKPVRPLGEGCAAVPELGLALAGDAFLGGRVESAAISGRQAAGALIGMG